MVARVLPPGRRHAVPAGEARRRPVRGDRLTGADATAGPEQAEALRAVMGHFASGVTVVTAVTGDVRHAMTATAVSSVSLDPPLVLVCVGRTSRFHDALLRAGRWALSVLGVEQRAIAQHFAHSGRDLSTQFDTVPYTTAPVSGAPVITGALAWLDLVTEATHEAGDHTIVIGRVQGGRWDPASSAPLTYYQGAFSAPDPARPTPG